MVKRLLFLFFILLQLTPTVGFSQTQFWSDTFEDSGAPSSGTRSPSVENYQPASAPYTKYFFRTVPGNLSLYNNNLNNGVYQGYQGAKIWAGEDIDAALNGSTNAQSAAQSVTWTNINISGKTGLSFKGLFACNNAANTWENGTSTGNIADNMVVSYRIDGGVWKDLVRLYANNTFQLALETTGDEVGDGTPLPSYQFTELGATITGSGNLLELRFSCYANGTGNEELAIDNFRLFYTGTLPVTLQRFDVRKDANAAVLNWNTASEQDNKGFLVYRSNGNDSFLKIGEVAAGNGNYSFYDRKPLNGDNYYRLVQVDMDGTETILETKVLSFLLGDALVTVYPNPTSGMATARFKAGVYSSAKLFDSNGKVLKTATFKNTATQVQLDLSGLAKGLYFMELDGKTGKEVLKLVKR